MITSILDTAVFDVIKYSTAFRRSGYGISSKRLWHFDEAVMAFHPSGYGISTKRLWHFDEAVMAFRRSGYGISTTLNDRVGGE
jgi:hypothetical protein